MFSHIFVTRASCVVLGLFLHFAFFGVFSLYCDVSLAVCTGAVDFCNESSLK